MSDPYAQHPGQPDPNWPQPQQAPTSPYAPQAPGSPYAQPTQAGFPAYGTQGQQPYSAQPGYFPGGQPPAKSNKGLIIGLLVGILVLLLLLCGGGVAWYLSADKDEPTTPTTQNSAPAATAAPPTSGSGQQNNNNAITAKYSSDFADVCDGGAILNAADYNAGSANKAFAFSNRPDRPTSWSHRFLDSTAKYYAKIADFTTVSVVACVSYVEGSETVGQKCDIKASDGKKLTVDYVSSRYTLTFYAAKTGQKIGDGGTVNAPATRCPSFMTYNKDTLKSYASPDEGTIDAAVEKLLGR
ncbi:hypothetical protein [Luedemannella helvata]|uniref:hypothetical protein n=1 Tax=Luedemannella helvata TaxID=349315 RepID=UPI0031D5564B